MYGEFVPLMCFKTVRVKGAMQYFLVWGWGVKVGYVQSVRVKCIIHLLVCLEQSLYYAQNQSNRSPTRLGQN